MGLLGREKLVRFSFDGLWQQKFASVGTGLVFSHQGTWVGGWMDGSSEQAFSLSLEKLYIYLLPCVRHFNVCSVIIHTTPALVPALAKESFQLILFPSAFDVQC